jgi:hypothetical protein
MTRDLECAVQSSSVHFVSVDPVRLPCSHYICKECKTGLTSLCGAELRAFGCVHCGTTIDLKFLSMHEAENQVSFTASELAYCFESISVKYFEALAEVESNFIRFSLPER